MKWYFKILGGHTHVRVFMNGGKCGDLVFRNEEFEQIKTDALRGSYVEIFTFIPDEGPPP